jgi:hypothetical protein
MRFLFLRAIDVLAHQRQELFNEIRILHSTKSILVIQSSRPDIILDFRDGIPYLAQEEGVGHENKSSSMSFIERLT